MSSPFNPDVHSAAEDPVLGCDYSAVADLVTSTEMAAPGSPVRYISRISFHDKGGKQLALNVLGTLRKQGGRSASMSSLIKRTAAFSNVTECALYKWVAQHDKHGEVIPPKTLFRGGRGHNREQLLDDFDLGVLRRVMHGFYEWREISMERKLTTYVKVRLAAVRVRHNYS
ncbi:hypothetical protein HPB51_024651 [Rhipicephalus microplus]|uniref:Uncharacterized protein n=1 Tax=Rhipicephalus microplus TaxID=6941 RepID=A0A9J6EKA5_RHIMP|nr:hypothetical protein HPB51_024651 [Rhipicephalus microplus]